MSQRLIYEVESWVDEKLSWVFARQSPGLLDNKRPKSTNPLTQNPWRKLFGPSIPCVVIPSELSTFSRQITYLPRYLPLDLSSPVKIL